MNELSKVWRSLNAMSDYVLVMLHSCFVIVALFFDYVAAALYRAHQRCVDQDLPEPAASSASSTLPPSTPPADAAAASSQPPEEESVSA